ncbi:MAG: hypothetical protein JRF28_05985 [Deltaproteobacteria bacterium]|nr:hypothetical protein [Deltaproteobacteria bacterium]MBW2318654.1 hypothetical protein [Deltaproteobacteria bacterium]OEU45819.1 MAG: hypothetical protein BBJ60_08735 [Desulfobacterales bacterium S7086C20]
MSESLEKRSEPRTELEKYHSVEFKVSEMASLYQFKIWNMSSRGMCLLVREDSEILNDLKVDSVFNMKYYTTDFSQPPEKLKTQIKHISREPLGRFGGHFLVGLFILDTQT